MALSFDGIVAGLQNIGVPRDRAEAIARKELGLADPTPKEVERAEAIDEKKEQSEIVKVAKAFGCVVYRLSQPRATMQDEGIGDMFIFHPHTRHAWWWETKRQVGGKRSAAQIIFAEYCEATDQGYGHGDRWRAIRN